MIIQLLVAIQRITNIGKFLSCEFGSHKHRSMGFVSDMLLMVCKIKWFAFIAELISIEQSLEFRRAFIPFAWVSCLIRSPNIGHTSLSLETATARKRLFNSPASCANPTLPWTFYYHTFIDYRSLVLNSYFMHIFNSQIDHNSSNVFDHHTRLFNRFRWSRNACAVLTHSYQYTFHSCTVRTSLLLFSSNDTHYKDRRV